jgi:hypothetical protein
VVKSQLARNELQQKMPDTQTPEEPELEQAVEDQSAQDADESREYGGPRGMEPTRYGDWEKNGRCIDF